MGVAITIGETFWPTGKTIAVRVWNPDGSANSTSLMTEGDIGVYGFSGTLTMADSTDFYEAEIRDITGVSGANDAAKFNAATNADQLVFGRGDLGIVVDQVLTQGSNNPSGEIPMQTFGPTTSNFTSISRASILDGTLDHIARSIGLAITHKSSNGPSFTLHLMISFDGTNFFEVPNVFDGASIGGNTPPFTYVDGSTPENYSIQLPGGTLKFRIEAQPATNAALQILAIGNG